MLVVIFLISLIPAIILYLWMKNRLKDDPEYKETCRKALIKGLLSTFLVALASGTLNLILALLIKDRDSVLYIALYNFFVLAFSEEASKMFMMRKLKKTSYPWSWMETIVFMTIVGIGFELIESLVYGFITNAGQMLVRGATMMHAVYGMIMGYFYGKAEYTGEKSYYALSLLVPWFLHGMYDFTLKEKIADINDLLLFMPGILVIVNMIVLFRMIRFLRKERDNEKYTAAIIRQEE
ncbi:MAG: PrsW family intramembrane metalloprotease [Solobacterium sp.]|nr:PrsW family intramembrane metalloprotease [Solobacterium sp.]